MKVLPRLTNAEYKLLMDILSCHLEIDWSRVAEDLTTKLSKAEDTLILPKVSTRVPLTKVKEEPRKVVDYEIVIWAGDFEGDVEFISAPDFLTARLILNQNAKKYSFQKSISIRKWFSDETYEEVEYFEGTGIETRRLK